MTAQVEPKAANVTTLPVAPFLLEFHSDRMVDLMFVLSDAGFTVRHVAGTVNRFRIDDAEDQHRA